MHICYPEVISMILCDKSGRVFTLHTRDTTYQMKADQCGVLLHTYYGPRVSGMEPSRLIRYAGGGSSPDPDGAGPDRAYPLDALPQEYSGGGAGGFRLPSLELELSGGSYAADLRYADFELRPGKYALEGLPAFFAGEDEAQTLIITLEDKTAQVAVELYYSVLEEFDLITWAVRVVNRGTRTGKLRRVASLCLDFPCSGFDLITFDSGHVKGRPPHRAPVRGGVQPAGSVRWISSRQYDPFVVLCEQDAGEDHGTCYGAMLLYSGNFEAAAERSRFEGARLTMGIHSSHFRWVLPPGGSFTAPEAALVCSPGGLGQMSRQLHRAIRAHLIRDPWKERRAPVLVHSWAASHRDFDREKLLDSAREAAALGAELFVLDGGFTGLGDRRANGEKLPEGLRRLSGEVNALGMEFGLRVEPEMFSGDGGLCPLYPDWVPNPPGRPHARGRGRLAPDFTRGEVLDYVERTLRKILDEANIAYIKWDMNRSPAQVCFAAVPTERQGEAYHRHVLGLYDLLERLRKAYPGILIEGCGRFDAGMLYYTPQIWRGGSTDAIDRLAIQYGASFAYPPRTMGSYVSAVPNGQTGRSVSLRTRAVVAMTGAFGYDLDFGKLPEEEKDLVKRQIRGYQRFCHLMREGDYYRLSAPSPDGAPTAWAHVSPDRREALVSVVAAQSRAAAPFRSLKLDGLDPALRYRVNGGSELWPGGVLTRAGLPLPPLREYDALHIHLQAE